MALFDQEEISALRRQLNIVEVIRGYIPLEQKGKNYFGVCPFHEDHAPSMSVSEDKQIYKCFSCGAAGNVFTFVQNYENITFVEAVNLLANNIGFSLSQTIISSKPEKNSHLYEIMDTSLKLFKNNLKTEQGTQAVNYLLDRGLSKEDIEEFEIGLALKEKNILYQVLKSKDYDLKDILNLGLINENQNDIFYNRIIFPLCDASGKVIAFSGRKYHDEDGPKYLNTKETVIFKKGQILFNYHRAKKEAKLKRQVILVEGYMDAIRLYINGFKNVVAIMGTALTKDQIILLRRLKCKIIMCLDNDIAGQKAMYDIGKVLTNQNFEVEVIKLSGAKDPDEYILTKGVEAFSKNYNNPLKYLDFTLQYLKHDKNLSETQDLANYINEVLKDLNNQDDEILKDLTLRKLSEEYKLDYDILKNKLNELITSKEDLITLKKEINDNTIKTTKYDSSCKMILYYMMNDHIYIDKFMEEMLIFDNVSYREIAKEIIYYNNVNKGINIADFLTFAQTSESFYPVILDIVSHGNDSLLDMQTFEDYLKSIKLTNKKNTIKELKNALKTEMDQSKKIEIATKIAEIKKGCV